MGSPRFVGDKKLFDFTLIFIRFHGSFCGRMWLRRKLNTSMSAAQCPNHREPPTPEDENFNALNMISHMRWNIMENPNDYVLQVFSHSSCYIFKISPVVKLWHTLSLYMFQDRDFTWWWFWWTYWWWWWWLAITKPGTMMAVMLTRETGQRFVVQYRLCVDSL